MESIYKRAQSGIIKVDILLNNDTGNYIGYCLSSIEDNLGEIESIFIEDNCRRFKPGDKLMKNALKWFESNSITNIEISVVYANDEVLYFYKRHGFRIGNYTLKRL